MPTGIYQRTQYHLERIREGHKIFSQKWQGHSKEFLEQRKIAWTSYNNPNYIDGRSSKEYYCKKCNKRISRGGGNLCRKCYKESALGENNPNWRGGRTLSNKIIRSCEGYRNWRKLIFKRDHFTCIKCGHRFIHIIAHHRKSVADYPYLIFDINNGITLCKDCHKKVHQDLRDLDKRLTKMDSKLDTLLNFKKK